MRTRLLSVVVVTLLHGAFSASIAQSSAPPKTVLVELFTSEGCSSCPPADALLAKFDGRKADTQTLMIGLSEHVTYWNRLGWADPFSQDLFTERQDGYGRRFHLQSVYTPQVVVNGAREMSGGDGPAILQAVKETGAASGLKVSLGAVEVTGTGVKAGFELTGAVPKGAELYAVIAQDKATTEVKRGENGGRTLTHVSVARSLVRVGKVGTERSVELPLPTALEGRRHLVLFVQEANLGKVLAVESAAF